MGEKEAPVTFDKLKDDLVKVAQDFSYLIKESLGEPGGKGLLGQLSRLNDTVKTWMQELDAKLDEKAQGVAKKGEETAETVTKGAEEKPEAEAKEGEEKPEAEAKEGEEKPEAEAKEGEEKPEGETVGLFDGSDESFKKWKHVGSGSFSCKEGALCIEAGDDLGLVYFEQGSVDDGVVRLKFRPETPEFEAGFALRFRDPSKPVPDRDNPERHYNYDNPAYVASHTGFFVQLANPRPGVVPGAFEGILIGEAPGAQVHEESGEIRTDDWNELEVEFEGDCFAVKLNGKSTARFTNVDAYRGKRSGDDPDAGFLGILFRKGNLRFKEVEFFPREARGAEAQPQAGEEAGQEAPH